MIEGSFGNLDTFADAIEGCWRGMLRAIRSWGWLREGEGHMCMMAVVLDSRTIRTSRARVMGEGGTVGWTNGIQM